ncbi:MAG: sensor histidine kinase, partial [Lachnospiraceae bacterium]|nr:sensor histidine kinase [Lachnospiraceae bacterium]
LTEDLVEVSKITSGNIELERVPIDFAELLRQSIGEFEDKFAEHELQVIDNIPEHSYMIFADGRRTFRILENLFQNIYKYAMPKTRVYIDLVNQNEQIFLSVKNISMAPLNINADELMERFVRGDQARTTEGSGLGLSIARDLVKMQDGEFQIYLDGDLFKVMISFPEFISSEVIDMEEAPESLEADDGMAIEKKNN